MYEVEIIYAFDGIVLFLATDSVIFIFLFILWFFYFYSCTS
jgi:hypothetical protein